MVSISEIKDKPEKYIKWMCYDILITVDNQVFDMSLNMRKEVLRGSSKCYYCNGKYRTKKWIRERCSYVLGYVTE